MKTTMICALLTILALVSVATAQNDDDWGFYFDTTDSTNCRTDVIGGMSTVYLILHNPTTALDITAWEGTLEIEGGLYVIGTTLPNGGVNYGQANEYYVGYVTPLPRTDNVILAEFSVLALSDGHLFLDKIVSQSSYVGPVYLDSDDVFRTMGPKFGGEGGGAIVFGSWPCPELTVGIGSAPVEARSWSSVKGLMK